MRLNLGVLVLAVSFTSAVLADGVDYTTAKDIVLDGMAADGKVAELRYLDCSAYPGRLHCVSPQCVASITFDPKDKGALKAVNLSNATVRFRIKASGSAMLHGELISIKNSR